MKTLIVIIIVLARLWSFEGKGKAQDRVIQGDFAAITNALQAYRINAGNYPSTDQGLKALVAKPDVAPRPRRWIQIMAVEPVDPWNRKYQYKLDGKKVKLWSKGPNPDDPKDDIHFPVK